MGLVEFYIRAVTRLLMLIPSAWLYRTLVGATDKVEFVNKDIEHLVSILYLADSERLKSYVPQGVSVSQILPRIGAVCIMGVKYRDVDGLGECSDFTVSVFCDYKGTRGVGCFPWFINDSPKIVEIANKQWNWPKALGNIVWKNRENGLDLAVEIDGAMFIDIGVTDIGSEYRIDQMPLPSLLQGVNGFRLSTVLLKRKYARASASIDIPASSRMAGFPLSSAFLDVYYAKDSEMNVLASEPV